MPLITESSAAAALAICRLYEIGDFGAGWETYVPLLFAPFPQVGAHLDGSPLTSMQDLQGRKIMTGSPIAAGIVQAYPFDMSDCQPASLFEELAVVLAVAGRRAGKDPVAGHQVHPLAEIGDRRGGPPSLPSRPACRSGRCTSISARTGPSCPSWCCAGTGVCSCDRPSFRLSRILEREEERLPRRPELIAVEAAIRDSSALFFQRQVDAAVAPRRAQLGRALTSSCAPLMRNQTQKT